MTDSPVVSVLMTARGAADGLAASLESALAQDHPAQRLEIVVVHDGDAGSIDALHALARHATAA